MKCDKGGYIFYWVDQRNSKISGVLNLLGTKILSWEQI